MSLDLNRIVADRMIDTREAAEAVQATGANKDSAKLASALQKDLGLSATDSVSLATRMKGLAGAAPGSFLFVDAKAAPADSPDLSHDAILIVGSGDVTRAPVPGASSHVLTSWNELRPILAKAKAVLDERRKTDPHARVLLDLNVHGNNGTAFKLLSHVDRPLPNGGTERRENASVASAAYIQQELAAVGLTPNDVTIVSEACNGGHSYTTTIDGFSQAERDRVTMQVHHLAQEDAQDFTKSAPANRFAVGNIETLDAAHPEKARRSYSWVGWDRGVNTTRVFVAYGAGEQTKKLFPSAPGHADPGSARMVVYRAMGPASVTEGEILNTREEDYRLVKQFTRNGGGKTPLVIAAQPR